MAWPLNILRIGLADNMSKNPAYQQNYLSEGDLIQQRFVANGVWLQDISIYIFDAGYEEEGNLEIMVCDMQGNVIADQKEELKNFKKNSLHTIEVRCKLQRQTEYELKIGLNSSKNIIFGTLKDQTKGASGNEGYIINGTASSECLAVNYQYQNDFNRIQTLMFWMICIYIYISVLWISLKTGWKNIAGMVCKRENLWQIWTILFLISLFNFAAFCSNAVSIDKSFSVIWKVFILWMVTVLGFVYLIRKEKRPSIKKLNLPLVLMLSGVLLLRIPMMNTIQKWDAGEYFYSLINACGKYEFSLGSFMDNFRLCTHSNLGYSFLMAIGTFFDMESSVGALTVNLILTLLAMYCLYELLQKYWLNCSKAVAAALTFVISCTPIFLGTFAYVNVDYMLALFLIFVIYTEYKGWNILMAFCAVILSQVKETGVVIVAGYFGLKILVEFLKIRGCLFKRIQGCLSKPFTWGATVAATVYAAMVVRLGSLSGWVQNVKSSQQASVSWSSTGKNCFGFQPKYILYKLMQFFVMNFAWVLTIIFLISLIVLIYKGIKEKKISGEKYIGLAGALIAFVLFGIIYVTYTLERYNIAFAVGFTILTVCLFYHAFAEKMKRATVPCVSVLGIIMLVQSFWNIDLISGKVFGTVPISEKNSMLFSCLDFPYYGDGLVCNYQYSWVDKAFDKLLRAVNYNDKMQVIVTRKQSVGTQLSGNGSAYPISWNVSEGKRVLRKTDGENIGINSISTETVFGVLPFRYIEANAVNTMKDRAVTYFIPYYQEDKEATLDILKEQYYIGEEKEVTAYGGVIQYYELLKKDDIAGVSLGELQQLLKEEPEKSIGKEKFSRELVVDVIEELGWSREKVQECARYNWESWGRIIADGGIEHDIIEKYDVIDMEVEAYDENGEKLGIDLIGNATGNSYDDVVVGSGKLLEGIDEALLGAKLGDTVEVVCRIPENYPIAGEYQGKDITFKLKPVRFVGVWKEETGEDAKKENYSYAERIEWENLSRKVKENIIIRTWNSEQKIDRKKLREYIVNIGYAYRTCWEKWGISREEFQTKYLQCSDEEYWEIMEGAAKAMLKREAVEDVLEEYKENWDFIENLFYMMEAAEEDAQQTKTNYVRRLTLNEITKEEVLNELYSHPVYGEALKELTDEEIYGEQN